MSVVSRNGTTAYIGLPEREATKLQDLWQRDEVGVELSVEVHAPVVVGIYPMRIARFVIDQTANGNGQRLPPAPRVPARGAGARMRVAAVISDLMLYSRIESAASAAGVALVRVDSPAGLPDNLDLVLVDWSARRPDWVDALAPWRDRAHGRLLLFGQHTDLEAHAAARAAGLGPMWARSKLLTELPVLLQDARGDHATVDSSPRHRGTEER